MFHRGYSLVSGNEPFPLRTILGREIDALNPGSILEVGCGSGNYSFLGHNYVGVDTNPKYIAHCRENRAGRFEVMSGDQLDFPTATFDAVLCTSVGHHLPDDLLQRVVREAKRVLTDRGIFFFCDAVRPLIPVLEWLDEGRHFRRREEYVALLGNEFTIEKEQSFKEAFYNMVLFSCRKKPGGATA
jgi:SAM-dependent methyltransferase